MIKKEVDLVKKTAKTLGWAVTAKKDDDGYYFCFSICSPKGRDFCQEFDGIESLEDLKHELFQTSNNFDVSEDAYMFLDCSGHGRNGAPHDMRDVYNDSEACENMLSKLSDAINNL